MKIKFTLIAVLLLYFMLFSSLKTKAASETIAAGAFIINMGSTPQTINNGLKPYGLIYDLLKNYQVPIKWIINSSKVKDGADFTHNGIIYKGGPFIIPVQFRTPAVNAVIASWQSSGVDGATTVSDITVDVYLTLQFVPQWTLDKDNGHLVTPFFVNAGIPASAHGGSSSSGWKLPSELNSCDDVFVLPHSDPTWATHQNLYYWNQTYKGNIWSACHGVSVLESVANPGATIQMNFLSNTGLVDFGSHNDGSPPYNYQYPTDQVMQFMGTFDGSTTNGSEQIYLPKLGGAWRAGTKLLVFDPTQADVPSISPGPAAVAIYGRAYNDPARGFVMYEAGHDLNKGGISERVAAQRAFFNFSFFSTTLKSKVDISLTNIPDVVAHGDTINIDFDLPPGFNPANYQIKWTSSCGGTFRPSDAIKQTSFIVPTNPAITSCVITVKLTDACGRINFASKSIMIVGGILENSWGDLTGKPVDNNVQLQWHTLTENNLDRFEIERSNDGASFEKIAIVFAKGNSSQKTDYSYTDKDIFAHNYYYRIHAFGAGNSEAFSNTVHVDLKNKLLDFKIVPNPFVSSSTVNFFTDKERLITLSCYDLTGKLMALSSLKINRGETRFNFKEIKGLPPGMYILKVENENSTYFRKLAVAN